MKASAAMRISRYSSMSKYTNFGALLPSGRLNRIRKMKNASGDILYAARSPCLVRNARDLYVDVCPYFSGQILRASHSIFGKTDRGSRPPPRPMARRPAQPEQYKSTG